jgi:capsular polysaccharide biosynthesis protein
MSLAQLHERQSAFSIHPVKARQSVEDARRLFASGDIDAAEKLTVETLLDCPNSFVGYQLLGELLDHQGQGDSAVQAYLGELPDSLVPKYLSAAANASSTGHAYERQIVHNSVTVDLPPPLQLPGGKAWKFGNNQVISNDTWVDTVENGRVWHDGHNTAVFDADGGLIEDHSMGSMAVVRELVHSNEPWYAGTRVFLLGARGGGNFYHWMTDILPKLAILRDAGFDFRESDRFVVPIYNKGFQKQTLAACGVSSDQVITAIDHSPYFCGGSVIVPRLKNVMGLHMGAWLPEFLQQSLLQDGSVTTGQRIFVSRDPAASNGRSIENIAELNELFPRYGFDVVFPERLSLAEQAQCFNNASVIFAPHGAGLTNIVFCKPGTKVVEFYGAHIAPCYWAISTIMGLEYYTEFCSPGEGMGGNDASTLAARRSAGFAVDVERLTQLLEMVGVD